MFEFSAMSESTGRINVKKTSKCAVSIADLSHDGAFVKLENTSSTKDFDLGDWCIERHHPKGKSTFKFAPGCTLKKGQSMKIFGADHAGHKDKKRDDLIGDKKECAYWGMGDGDFSLKDTSGNEKASSQIQFI